jgi:hypothetical protein
LAHTKAQLQALKNSWLDFVFSQFTLHSHFLLTTDAVGISSFGDVADYRIDDVVRDTWEGISKEHVSKLIASMPKRCQAVIDADGWYTHF